MRKHYSEYKYLIRFILLFVACMIAYRFNFTLAAIYIAVAAIISIIQMIVEWTTEK